MGTKAKAPRAVLKRRPRRLQEKALDLVDNRGGGWYRIMEPSTGAWQRNDPQMIESVVLLSPDMETRWQISQTVPHLTIPQRLFLAKK